MERISDDVQFSEAIKGEKVIIVFHKPLCSNCEKMKPAIEELCSEQPDIKLYDVLVEPENKEDEKSMPPSWMIQKMPRKVTFPVVMCYSKEKRIFMVMSIFPVNFLAFPFLDVPTLSLDHAHTIIMQKALKKQHEQDMEYINKEQHARMAVIERLIQIANPEQKEEEPWILNEPTFSEEDAIPCENCT